MIFPWTRKKKPDLEQSIAPEKEKLERLQQQRRQASAKVEETLKKILEIKETKHGNS